MTVHRSISFSRLGVGVLGALCALGLFAAIARGATNSNASAIVASQEALVVFEDAGQANAVRLQAIARVTRLGSNADADRVQAVLWDQENSEAIRLRALELVAGPLGMQSQFRSELGRLVKDRAQPAELRLSAAQVLTVMSFGGLHPANVTGEGMNGHREAREALVELFRSLLDDPDVRLQRLAFNGLAPIQEKVALDRLAAVAEGERSAAVTQAQALDLLSLGDYASYFPAIYRGLRATKDDATRVAAIRLLGGYSAAREDLIRAAQNSDESTTVRQAAMGAILSNDPQAFVSVALPILREEGPRVDSLKAYAIQGARLIRSRPGVRFAEFRDGAAFDRAVQEIATTATGDLPRVAQQYLYARSAD